MKNSVEQRYISNLDRAADDEVTRMGILSEELLINSTNANLPEFRARLSTAEEDSGRQDIGSRQIVDAVIYYKDRPAMAVQITTSEDLKIQRKKMQEIINQPFIRLAEMKPKDPAIPKGLIHLPRELVQAYSQNPKIANSPEATLKILDGYINSLRFSLTQTKNPQEQMAIKQLINQFTEEQTKHLQ